MIGLQFYAFGLICAAGTVLHLVQGNALLPQSQAEANNDRQKRELSATSLISDLAQQFFNRGGQQGVNDLNNANSESKMGVLQRYLGPALMSAVMSKMMGGGGNTGGGNTGNSGNTGNDLISTILSSFTGGGGGSKNGAGTGTPTNPKFEPQPGSNKKTGVSIIESRPSDKNNRGPSPTSSDDDGYSGSSSGRNSGSTGSRDRDTYSPSGASSGNSRSGVSLVDSRPGDRRQTASSGRNNDYDTDSLNGDVEPAERTKWGAAGASSRDRGSDRGSYGGFSEDHRNSGSSTEIFRSRGSRTTPSRFSSDY